MESQIKRQRIVGGNWKCNGSVQQVKDLVNDVLNKAEFDPSNVCVVVAPISLHISLVKALAKDNIQVAVQNVGQQGKGAFTGEISADQLKDFDINWVLIGHSERRTIFKESNETVAAKLALAQDHGLYAILCCGESLEQREAGFTNGHIKNQLDSAKASIKDWSKIVIAYEPIWAIGTGKTATPEIAQEAHQFIRSWVKENSSDEIAQGIRIQYGGSVTGKNAVELISKPDIDGFLVGGASLKPEFLDIITACNNKYSS